NNPNQFSISLLYNVSAHIFPPSKVTVQGLENGKWNNLASGSPSVSLKPDPARSELLNLQLSNTSYEKLKITVFPLPRLPKWHPNAEDKGWVFVDELIFNR